MSVPADIIEEISEALGVTISNSRSVSGGSINQAALLDAADGAIFLKWNSRPIAADMFEKEEKGLELLRTATNELWIPEPLRRGTHQGTAYFAMTAFPDSSGSAKSDLDHAFGVALARLHQTTSDRFGLDHDNYIGRLPQSNSWHEDWATFFAEERIRPLLKQAIDQGKISTTVMQAAERFFAQLDNLFPETPPALLHGDLWGGNYTHLSDQTAIYDPAVYFGHPEMELAFTHLFGGFGSGFYAGYESIAPLESGFTERRSYYNVYHLLTHTVMFGGHYARQATAILNQF
ncbi:MAG: fructosamine kinase family protein [Bacteroidota bacterium]